MPIELQEKLKILADSAKYVKELTIMELVILQFQVFVILFLLMEDVYRY